MQCKVETKIVSTSNSLLICRMRKHLNQVHKVGSVAKRSTKPVPEEVFEAQQKLLDNAKLQSTGIHFSL